VYPVKSIVGVSVGDTVDDAVDDMLLTIFLFDIDDFNNNDDTNPLH